MGTLSSPKAFASLPYSCTPKTGKPPSKTVYVGDQATDILAAKSAGVLAVGAIWDVNASEDDLRSAGADIIAKEPIEILDLVTAGGTPQAIGEK